MNMARFCLLAIVSLASTSCSNSNRIYPVSGKVMYAGHPASDATVFFYRRGGDAMNDPLIMGIVQPDGSFELACGSIGKGAPAGDYDVVIEWKARSRHNGDQSNGRDKLNGRFSDTKHPLLHAKVEAEANNLPPFDLRETNPVSNR